MPELELLVTCEHGGNSVPPEYRALFAGAEEVLASHRGFDAGALDVARALAGRFGAKLVYSETTRLLIDLNRSPTHRQLHSDWTRGLSAEEKRVLRAVHYSPYRAEVEETVAAAVRRGRFVLHVSSHSFSPVLDGVHRKADIGLLFDPRRPSEARLAVKWREALRAAFPHTVVRRNFPYRGTSDGLTTHLRKRFPDTSYAGMELEVNQRLAAEPDWQDRAARIAATFPMPELLPSALASPRLDR